MRKATQRIIRDYGITVLVAVGIAFLIRAWVIEAYQIPNFAMKPTLLAGDTIFVAKWPLWLNKSSFPERGDVVIFSEPSSTTPGDLPRVKRILGLPGDRIEIKKGALYLNKELLSPPTEAENSCKKETLPTGRGYEICTDKVPLENMVIEEVPKNSVFAISDFRFSTDPKNRKQVWGIVPIVSLKGKALWVWLSVEPHEEAGKKNHWFPSLRLSRMFRRIQ